MKDLSMIAQLMRISPIILVSAWAILVLLVESYAQDKESHRKFVGHLTLVGLVGVLLLQLLLMTKIGPKAVSLFHGRVLMDGFAMQMGMLFTVGALLTVLLSPPYLEGHKIDFGEYYPLMLFSVAGMMIVAAAGELMVLVIGIETMSLPIYALCSSWRKKSASQREEASLEASFKYFIMGAFSTAISVYGIALVYGATGTTLFSDLVALGPQTATKGLLIVGMVMLIGGLGFKVAAVPFHMWTPDVYEGAPTPITGFMAAAVKAAAFAAMLRVFTFGFGTTELAFGANGWMSILAILAAVTMILGNLTALWQQNVKRMLAYSSIAHAGYLLIGVIAAGNPTVSAEARSAVVFYLWAYTFTTIGAFGIIAWIGQREDRERVNVDDWAGLGRRRPVMALAMTIFLLSLAGVPPTAGFFGKFFLFKTALANSGLMWLIVLGLLTSVVSVFYYLRVVVAMYFKDAPEDDTELQPFSSTTSKLALFAATMFVLGVGLYPTTLWNYASKALMSF
jgi:NADH-quinone oxidoreductase subunit N